MTITAKPFSFFKDHWAEGAAIGIALFAFTLRFWLFVRYRNPLMLHEQDAIAYIANAREILSFRFPANLYMPPFYSLVIAFFALLPIEIESAARVASITMDALVVLPLFGLARIFLPRMASLSVCLLWATFSFGLFYSMSPLSQSTYLMMLLSGTCFLARGTTNSSGFWQYWVSGICLSAAYQTRPEGIVALGAGLLLVLGSCLGKGVDRRRQVTGAALFASAFALCSLAYILALYAQLGHWTFTAKTSAAIKGMEGSLTLGSAGGAAKNGVALWLEQFGGIAGGLHFIKENVTGFFAVLLLTFPVWSYFFVLAGLLYMCIGKNVMARLFLLIPFLVTVPVYVANLPKDSAYIYPLYPLYMIAFVAGLQWVSSLAQKGISALRPAFPEKIYPLLQSVVMLLPISFIAINSWNDVNANFKSPDYLYQVDIVTNILKAAGDELKLVSKPGEPVMTRWGLISYFADRPLVVLPKGNIDEVLAHGRKTGARLFVLDTGAVETRRQELAELLNPLYGGGIAPKYRLQVVAAKKSEVGGYVIYRYIQ